MTSASVASQDVVAGLYRNTTEGFSLTLPDGWVGQENEDTFPLLSIQAGEEGPPASAQVWIFRRFDDASAEAWLDAQLGQYNPDTRHSSGPYSLPEAESAHQSRISSQRENGSVGVELWTAVARGSQMFLLRVRATEEVWSEVEPQANAFTGSFALEAPMPFGVSRDDSLFQYWGEIVSIDPALSRRGAGDIVGAIFSGLVKLDTDLEVVADMAKAWEVSPDGTVFTFTLRDNAGFHDGARSRRKTSSTPGNGRWTR